MPTLANDRHERFCLALVASPTWDVAASYSSAGYKAEGESARAAGARLLQNVTVQARIAEMQAARAERLEITVDDVVRGLHDEATKSDNPGSVRVAAWAHLGKHVGAFEADNVQRAANILVDLTSAGRGGAGADD